jgi:molybdopterin/thiamine biosynthesis adenylyltransferase/rhodanese-related sulfurtransferase
MSVELNNEEVQRYARHLILPQVGMEGQKKLKNASILLIGAGGLGSPLGLYLAAAGIGRLGLVDFDVVDYSNLQRQIIHTTQDVGRKKIESAKESILAINPFCQVDTYDKLLNSENAMEIAKNYDIIIDGTDNFPTRYLVNDICVFLGKVNVYGSIYRFDGQATVFDAKKGPCYRCLYPDPPPPGMVPSCAEGGVLGILPGLIGVTQATEAIKVILGEGEPLIGRLLTVDTMGMNFRTLKIRKDPECPVCGENPSITEPIDYEMFCGVSAINDTKPAAEESDINVHQLQNMIQKGEELNLIDVRQPNEWDICHLSEATLIPLDTLNERVTELDTSKEYVVMCRSGARSRKAIGYLKEMGFTKLRNLDGGILAWADEIDPTMAKY